MKRIVFRQGKTRASLLSSHDMSHDMRLDCVPCEGLFVDDGCSYEDRSPLTLLIAGNLYHHSRTSFYKILWQIGALKVCHPNDEWARHRDAGLHTCLLSNQDMGIFIKQDVSTAMFSIETYQCCMLIVPIHATQRGY